NRLRWRLPSTAQPADRHHDRCPAHTGGQCTYQRCPASVHRVPSWSRLASKPAACAVGGVDPPRRTTRTTVRQPTSGALGGKYSFAAREPPLFQRPRADHSALAKCCMSATRKSIPAVCTPSRPPGGTNRENSPTSTPLSPVAP